MRCAGRLGGSSPLAAFLFVSWLSPGGRRIANSRAHSPRSSQASSGSTARPNCTCYRAAALCTRERLDSSLAMFSLRTRIAIVGSSGFAEFASCSAQPETPASCPSEVPCVSSIVGLLLCSGIVACGCSATGPSAASGSMPAASNTVATCCKFQVGKGLPSCRSSAGPAVIKGSKHDALTPRGLFLPAGWHERDEPAAQRRDNPSWGGGR